MFARAITFQFSDKAHLWAEKNLKRVCQWRCLGQSCLIARLYHDDGPPTRPTLKISYVHGLSNIPLTPMTMGQCLEESTNKFPDREAVIFVREGIRKTFAQLNHDVDQLAAGLLALGLKKGERIGMWGPNTYEWILFQYATAKAGLVMVSVNPAYQSKELEYALSKVGCKALVFPSQFKTQRYYEILKAICPEMEKANPGGIQSCRLPDLKIAIVLDGKFPGAFQMKDVMNAGSSTYVQQLHDLQKTLSCDDPVNIQFTSGTTGNPKGATLTHHNIVNNAKMIGYRMGYQWRNLRICLPVPLYHCFGAVGGGIVISVFAGTLVFPSPSFEGKATLEAVEKEKCTVLYGTPTMFIDMLANLEKHKCDMSSLEAGIVAASPVPVEVFKKVMSEMKFQEFVVGYGTTENSPVTFIGFPQDEILRKTDTVGYVGPHIEAKVVNTATQELLPVNTTGELMIRGYCVMQGYWADPVKTAECMTPTHWYKTGDLASMDEYGYVKIVGRCKDLIIRGGENIYPAEIEQFLHTHPKILEAQIVGVKDERMGEEVCAALRLREGQECTAEEIKAFCKGQISHFKIPRYVVFVKSYPLTVTGKIQKYKLKEEMEKQLGL
ncbi:medium-chain acyl-CoA ligase ACSF2, mitochondrial-like [Protopterus annectens]|uniref:medium-chain acyl-CoA ligase ACSF2, mitochondrial-like n=1 Tax=Protopterus annectens TaxID=7888 RepID=UPI001CFB0A37|nr:medium-chain acyl-CoA ligase ACSF2, mitochondrial-like [Protopterus annectens]